MNIYETLLSVGIECKNEKKWDEMRAIRKVLKNFHSSHASEISEMLPEPKVVFQKSKIEQSALSTFDPRKPVRPKRKDIVEVYEEQEFVPDRIGELEVEDFEKILTIGDGPEDIISKNELMNHGILTYDDLLQATDEQLKSIGDPGHWRKQTELLVSGDTDELEYLQNDIASEMKFQASIKEEEEQNSVIVDDGTEVEGETGEDDGDAGLDFTKATDEEFDEFFDGNFKKAKIYGKDEMGLKFKGNISKKNLYQLLRESG